MDILWKCVMMLENAYLWFLTSDLNFSGLLNLEIMVFEKVINSILWQIGLCKLQEADLNRLWRAEHVYIVVKVLQKSLFPPNWGVICVIPDVCWIFFVSWK